MLRLLELTDEVKQLVEHRELEMGHARALLTLSPELASKLAHDAAENGWSPLRWTMPGSACPARPAWTYTSAKSTTVCSSQDSLVLRRFPDVSLTLR